MIGVLLIWELSPLGTGILTGLQHIMKKRGNKQCLLDTPRRVTVNNNNTCIKIMQKVREKQLKALYIYAYTKAMALIKFT